MTVLLLWLFFLLTAIGLPIGFMLGITALAGFHNLGNPVYLSMLSQKFFSAMNSYTFLALPLFLMAGDIMNKVGLTERIMNFSNIFFGRLRGGLAQVNIVSSIIFGGISGSAVADTAALGSVFIPTMEKEGYGRPFSAAVTAASSIIAPIIPPSIIMVIYGGLMGVSIAGLFAAGLLPGLMIGLGLMLVTRFISHSRGYPQQIIPFTAKNVAKGTRQALWALMMPVIILGGILGGIFTPTEAAAVAVAYALFLGFVVYRNLNLKDLYGLLFRNAVMLGVITLILSSAAVMGWLLAIEQVPQKVAAGLATLTSNKYLILLLINLFLIIVGMLMDIMASLIILAPVLGPVAVAVGVDPLHFGIMMCVNLSIALITPPMGGCMFAAMVVGNVSFAEIVKEVLPFILVEIVVLVLIIFVPEITMIVPRLLGFVQ
jgi:tripartite ATP-independent transporter DctM subunit